MQRPVSNPPNPWSSTEVEWLGEPPSAALSVYEERAKSILSENKSPDVGFRFSVNPYRGCFHGCLYCYARPSHQYWGFGAGTDFERKIVVKVNAPELLRQAFDKPSWRGDIIALSGNTDCYQPLEASYGITRRLLEVCLEFQNPVSIITKSALIRRDVDVLRGLTERASCHVSLSIPFADDRLCHQVEPYTAPPSRRFDTLRILSEAGISTGVALAPIIPGLNDTHIPEILERARAAGARRAFCICVRLPREVLPVFREGLAQQFPEERVRSVWNAIAGVRGGRTNQAAFGARMVGQGPRWQMIEQLFASHCRRLGLHGDEADPAPPTSFRRPRRQLSLF